MDKLKPILEQKFWILSGLCLIMPLTGWWISTGALSAAYAEREKKIDEAHKGIPSPGPNKLWAKRVADMNKEEEQKVVQTSEFVWSNQLPLMTWPESLLPAVEKAGYRGEIDSKTRGDYRYVYEKELEDIRKIISPFDSFDGSGLVDAAPELIPNLGWAMSVNPPTTKEIWDTQEDIWLYRAIYQAIANINIPPNGNSAQASTSIVDSKIKQIVDLQLRGGTPGGGPKSGSGPGAPTIAAGGMPGLKTGGPPGSPGGPGGMPTAPGYMAGGKGAMGGMGAAGADSGVASFDPTEQFGPDDDTTGGSTATGATGGAATKAATPPMGPSGPTGGAPGMDPKMMMGGMGGMGGMNANVPRKRYIEELGRFKTRGFYLEVVMDHNSLPEFIAELSDSHWPVRVIRVQSVDRDLSDVGSDQLGAGGMGMGGMSSPKMGSAAMGMMPRGTASGSAVRPPAAMGMGGLSRSSSKMSSGIAPMRPGYGTAPGGELGGEGTVSLEAALSDPYLVNVAIAGIFTLYLPPEPIVATPGAPGAPQAAAPAPGAPGTPGAATAPAAPASGTAPAAAGSTPPAVGTTPATAPAAAAPAAASPTEPANPAADSTATPSPATPPATTSPTASPAAPPAATDQPAENK